MPFYFEFTDGMGLLEGGALFVGEILPIPRELLLFLIASPACSTTSAPLLWVLLPKVCTAFFAREPAAPAVDAAAP